MRARKLFSSVQGVLTRIQGGKERHPMTVRFVLTGLLVCSSMGFAQTPDPCATAPQTCATLIEAHATSEMRIPNTAVDVSVGVSASGKDLPEVQRALADQSNKLLGYLQGQQVERLITTRVSFAPDTRGQRSGPDKTVGYDGSARISFRAKPEKVADILAGGVDERGQCDRVDNIHSNRGGNRGGATASFRGCDEDRRRTGGCDCQSRGDEGCGGSKHQRG
jgi:uncharacterized protein YggE